MRRYQKLRQRIRVGWGSLAPLAIFCIVVVGFQNCGGFSPTALLSASSSSESPASVVNEIDLSSPAVHSSSTLELIPSSESITTEQDIDVNWSAGSAASEVCKTLQVNAATDYIDFKVGASDVAPRLLRTWVGHSTIMSIQDLVIRFRTGHSGASLGRCSGFLLNHT